MIIFFRVGTSGLLVFSMAIKLLERGFMVGLFLVSFLDSHPEEGIYGSLVSQKRLLVVR